MGESENVRVTSQPSLFKGIIYYPKIEILANFKALWYSEFYLHGSAQPERFVEAIQKGEHCWLANFEAFYWDISSSINLLFLKSGPKTHVDFFLEISIFIHFIKEDITKFCKFSVLSSFLSPKGRETYGWILKSVHFPLKIKLMWEFSRHKTLIRNKRFALNEIFQRNASKFAIFHV